MTTAKGQPSLSIGKTLIARKPWFAFTALPVAANEDIVALSMASFCAVVALILSGSVISTTSLIVRIAGSMLNSEILSSFAIYRES